MTRYTSDEIQTGALGVGLILLIVFALIVLKAFVLSCLWAWYVVPLFGAPPLPMAYAFGLSLLVSQFVPHTPMPNNDRNLRLLTLQVFAPVFVLILGRIGLWFT